MPAMPHTNVMHRINLVVIIFLRYHFVQCSEREFSVNDIIIINLLLNQPRCGRLVKDAGKACAAKADFHLLLYDLGKLGGSCGYSGDN